MWSYAKYRLVHTQIFWCGRRQSRVVFMVCSNHPRVRSLLKAKQQNAAHPSPHFHCSSFKASSSSLHTQHHMERNEATWKAMPGAIKRKLGCEVSFVSKCLYCHYLVTHLRDDGCGTHPGPPDGLTDSMMLPTPLSTSRAYTFPTPIYLIFLIYI